MGKQFFVALEQGPGRIDHQHALALGKPQQMDSMQELRIHRRVLAHQDNVKFTQRADLRLTQFIPVVRVAKCRQVTHTGMGTPITQMEILLFHIVQRPPTLLS